MKLSHHSIIRMSERTDLKNKQEKRRFFREALRNGRSYDELKDGKIKSFMYYKAKYCGAKVYKGYVFIYSKNSKQLYTMYKLPDKLIGDEKSGEKGNI